MARQLPPNHGSWLSFGQRQNSHIVFFSISPSPKRPTPRKASFRAAELPPSGFESGEIRAREPRRITSLHTRAPFVAYRSPPVGGTRCASTSQLRGHARSSTHTCSQCVRHDTASALAQDGCSEAMSAAEDGCSEAMPAAEDGCSEAIGKKLGVLRMYVLQLLAHPASEQQGISWRVTSISYIWENKCDIKVIAIKSRRI